MRGRDIGRVAAWVVAAGATAAVIAVAVVYAGSEYVLRRKHEAPYEAVVLPTDAAALEHGRRRALIVGCYNSCHGRYAEGQSWIDEPGVARLFTPNLTQLIPTYSDAELVRLLRYGIRRDGTTAIDMPSYMFYHLSDSDLASVIAYMRSLPPRAGPQRIREFGWRGRWRLLTGAWPTSVDDVDRAAKRAADLPRKTAIERGHYVAVTTCPECHGPALEGYPGDTPPLTIIAAYSFEEFTTLMRTGVAKGGRTLGLMSEIGSIRTPNLTDEEVADLYAYLQSRVEAGATRQE
jgi:mono/diheme cytochrome c family protein